LIIFLVIILIDRIRRTTPRIPNSSPPRGRKEIRLAAPIKPSTHVRMKVPQAAHPIPKIPLTSPPIPAAPFIFETPVL
jgi:hypothetical protein